jgi:hypothetical protein
MTWALGDGMQLPEDAQKFLQPMSAMEEAVKAGKWINLQSAGLSFKA